MWIFLSLLPSFLFGHRLPLVYLNLPSLHKNILNKVFMVLILILPFFFFFHLFRLLSSLPILTPILFCSPPPSSTSSCSSLPLSLLSRSCPLHLPIHPLGRNIPYERLVSTTVRCRGGPCREVMLRFSWLSSVPRVLKQMTASQHISVLPLGSCCGSVFRNKPTS